ncbi:MAG: DUF5793 family protein [Halolamina sp.]|uniref:DUF5793 family protein n=1 Tax=Halolamina sp. TaxID=1940283 RepID=UPI002FC2C58B
MRRDYFELEVTNIDWLAEGCEPVQPLVQIEFSGPGETLRERLSDADGNPLEGDDVDVAFRLQGNLDEESAAPGVVAVTNRITGDFVLELNETADDVLRFIDAARAYSETEDGGGYRVIVSIDGDPLAEYEKQTFLVYDAEGEFLREESLIPSGVEL